MIMLSNNDINMLSKNCQETLRKPKLCSTATPPEFCPKEPLNSSRNPITSCIPVWKKSQVFGLHLTTAFGSFNFRIRTFDKQQSCSPSS